MTDVKGVPTLGWQRADIAATIRYVNQQQRNALADRVRAEMDQRAWNNPKLARQTGLSEKTISRVINAKRDPRLDTLERLAQAFGLTEQEMLGSPPAPLGLGAAVPTQLDRIEEGLKRLLELAQPSNGHESGFTPPEWKELERFEELVARAEKAARRSERAAHQLASLLKNQPEGEQPAA